MKCLSDNTGDSGVFVIGSTNKPQLIDKAVLGRENNIRLKDI